MVTPKVIITVAPTGGVGERKDNPNLPTQPQQIADSVYSAYNAGASIVALHARREDDSPSCDPALYGEMNRLIRDKCDIILNNSTAGGPYGEMARSLRPQLDEIMIEERLRSLDALPEMGTFDAFSTLVTFGGRNVLLDTGPAHCDQLAEKFREKGVKPEWEAFSLAHIIQEPARLIASGFDKPPYYFNIVLNTKGFQNADPYTPKILQHLVDHLPQQSVFCVSGIGTSHFAATTHSILLGGHVRVGLEDNWYYRRGELATNEQLVERMVRIVRELGAEPATAEEARAMLGLPSLQAAA